MIAFSNTSQHQTKLQEIQKFIWMGVNRYRGEKSCTWAGAITTKKKEEKEKKLTCGQTLFRLKFRLWPCCSLRESHFNLGTRFSQWRKTESFACFDRDAHARMAHLTAKYEKKMQGFREGKAAYSVPIITLLMVNNVFLFYSCFLF